MLVHWVHLKGVLLLWRFEMVVERVFAGDSLLFGFGFGPCEGEGAARSFSAEKVLEEVLEEVEEVNVVLPPRLFPEHLLSEGRVKLITAAFTS